MTTVVSSQQTPGQDDVSYAGLLAGLQKHFEHEIAAAKSPVFSVNLPDLFSVYLANLPEADRQHHTCHACRNFVNRFGNTVTIQEDGTLKSLMWDASYSYGIYTNAILALKEVVEKAAIEDVFISSEKVYGQTRTGEWTHLAIRTVPKLVYKGVVKTAGQLAAEKREDFKTLSRAMSEFSLDNLNQAVTMLTANSLYRSEKVLGMATWLRDLQDNLSKVKGSVKTNTLWRAVGTAPAGFATPRSSVIGSLIEDLAAGLAFNEVKAKFDAKMNPSVYMRPENAPKAGHIAAAEKVMEKLGAAGSLQRRFAKFEDIPIQHLQWKPAPPVQPKAPEGVFGHLLPEEAKAQALELPVVVITWDKFQRTVLPTATKIEYKARPRAEIFQSLVTAVNTDAPPILQWDNEEHRNPVSWYMYIGGSRPTDWNLATGKYHEVVGICLKPSLWNDPDKHLSHGKGALFLIKNCRDMNPKRVGAALFPEILKAEYHPIRRTIEAFSSNATLAGEDVASACGLLVGESDIDKSPPVFRVYTGTSMVDYAIDRWD